MLFLGLQAKVKLFIEKDTQRNLAEIEDQKRHFKASIAALDNQKRKERLIFARTVNQLKRLYKAETSQAPDYTKLIGSVRDQIEILTGMNDAYDARIAEMKTVLTQTTLVEEKDK